MPPPTESHILTSFLLPPSPLPTILPPSAFTALFPPSTPASSIARLYRLLSHQRALLTDAVKADIEDEVRRGVAQRRAVVRTRREREWGEEEEVGIERALSPTNPAPLARPRHHTLLTILPTLDTSTEDIETEIALLELEAETLLAGIRNTVGGLSDLRYGRFRNQEVGEGVRGALEGVGGN
ncbi:hypothetical protein VF21_07372 [Pseudogymnoascus sp. 05NY08]|nr:hypothetical protein VF21_07372 [Pseudogymnoascus sp. 05NY08]